MSAYFTAKARPVLSVADGAALRAEPSGPLAIGQLAVFSGAGATFFHIARYNPSSLGIDDGVNYWQPNDILGPTPGRWEIFGSDLPTADVYVKRDAGGGIAGFSSADFVAPVAHVNWATGANDPVPAVLCGISVDRGSIAGVERNRPGLFWNETPAEFAVAYDTAGDDTTISAYAPIRVGGLFSGAGGPAVGFLRMVEDELANVKIAASTYRLFAGLSAGGGSLAFGDSASPATTLDAGNDVTITSRLSSVYVRGGHFYVYDSGGVTQLLDASTGGAYLNVVGRLRAYNGATLVFDTDVASAIARVNGSLRAYDSTGVSLFFDASSVEVKAQRDAIGTTATVGFAIRNTTLSTALATVQRAPVFLRESHVRIGGVDAGYLIRQQFIPTTSSTWRDVIEVSTNGGGAYSEFMRLTSSTPNQFVEALLVTNMVAVSTGGGFQFDADGSGMTRGGSGDLQLTARASAQAFLFRSPTNSGSIAAFRFYANGATLGATRTIVEYGDVAAGFTLRNRIMGDGVVEAPEFHVDATVHAAGGFTAALWTLHMVDLSGAAVTATIPAASAANAGDEILIVQSVAGVGTLNLTPSAGTIEGVATIALTGTASVPFLAARLVSCGVGAGSPGWKVI